MGLTKGNLNRQVTIGGATFDWDPTGNPNDIQLVTEISGASTKYGSGRKGAATAGYAVPSGRTMYVVAMKLFTVTAVATSPTLCQADNDSGVITTTAPTNPVYLCGNGISVTNGAATIGTVVEIGGLAFPVAALKYLTAIGGSSETAVLHFYCKLI